MKNWDDLNGSEQTAVEYFRDNYGTDIDDEKFNDDVRNACWKIGEANQELVDSGYWYGNNNEIEPNIENVKSYLIKNKGGDNNE